MTLVIRRARIPARATPSHSEDHVELAEEVLVDALAGEVELRAPPSFPLTRFVRLAGYRQARSGNTISVVKGTGAS
jgi:hypothetical protein